MRRKGPGTIVAIIAFSFIKFMVLRGSYDGRHRERHSRPQVASVAEVRRTHDQISQSAEAQLEYASTYAQQGNMYKAIHYATAAIELDGQAVEPYVLRAAAYLSSGDGTAAARDVERALKLAPEHPSALALQAQLEAPLPN